jgi:hypothetical protein
MASYLKRESKKQEYKNLTSQSPKSKRCFSLSSGGNQIRWQKRFQDRFDPMRLLFDLGHQQAQEGLEIEPVGADVCNLPESQSSLELIGEHGHVLPFL